MPFDADTEFELAKYRKAYTQSPRYAMKSGTHIFLDEAKVREYTKDLDKISAADFGCGNGQSALLLNEIGFSIVDLIDFVGYEFVHPDVKELVEDGNARYFTYTLWGPAVKTLPTYDFTVCTDVMEHIPEKYVDEVMRTIRSKTRFNGVSYWRIALWGSETPEEKAKAKAKYGGELHVTVRPPEWWVEKLVKLYGKVDYEVWQNPRKPNRRVLIAFCSPDKTPPSE